MDKFIFPAYFIILEIEEDKEVSIVLGRPFLAMGRALSDVHKGELKPRVQDEEVTFKVLNSIKHPHDNDKCFKIDVIEATMSSQLGQLKPLETRLTYEDHTSCDDHVVQEYVKWMDSFRLNKRKYFESLGASPSRLTPFIEKPPSLKEKPLHATSDMPILGKHSYY